MTASNPFIGIGLRYLHQQQVLDEKPTVDWFEVHSENFFHAGGYTLHTLCKIRESYPISLHGVGLSLGNAHGIQQQHLLRLRQLIELIDPFLISEHLSWSGTGKTYLPDLLPIPYNNESFQIFCDNINKTQDFLKREILIENPSSYFEYQSSKQDEVSFLVALAQKTGAKILLDVNNVYVSCSNHGWDAKNYLSNIPVGLVKEIHLAGHVVKEIANDCVVRIDTHNGTVCQEVWELYAEAIKQFGKTPSLLEWDSDIPALSVLIAEAKKIYSVIPESMKDLSEVQRNIVSGSRFAQCCTMHDRDESKKIQHHIQTIILQEPAQVDLDFISSNYNKERFAIYRQTLFENLRHALELTYPGIWKLLGEECANSVAYHFIKQTQNLPISGCLDDWGAEFGCFLATIPELKSLPYLKDVAIFEWYKHQSDLALDAATVELRVLQQFSDNELNDLKFKFHSSVFLLQSLYPLQKILDVIENPDKPGFNLNKENNYVVIVRIDYQVEVFWLEQKQWQFLNDLKQGKTLSEACNNEFDLSQMIYFMFDKKMVSQVLIDTLIQNQLATTV